MYHTATTPAGVPLVPQRQGLRRTPPGGADPPHAADLSKAPQAVESDEEFRAEQGETETESEGRDEGSRNEEGALKGVGKGGERREGQGRSAGLRERSRKRGGEGR